MAFKKFLGKPLDVFLSEVGDDKVNIIDVFNEYIEYLYCFDFYKCI